MVGGVVIEVIKLEDKIWVDTMDRKRLDDRCAIYVERTDLSERIKPNDSLWWQGSFAYWTPKENRENNIGASDIEIKRFGFSGVSKPAKVSA